MAAVIRASGHLDVKHKKTGQICLREKPSVSDVESSSLPGFFAFIGSNLCTRPLAARGRSANFASKHVTSEMFLTS